MRIGKTGLLMAAGLLLCMSLSGCGSRSADEIQAVAVMDELAELSEVEDDHVHIWVEQEAHLNKADPDEVTNVYGCVCGAIRHIE